MKNEQKIKQLEAELKVHKAKLIQVQKQYEDKLQEFKTLKSEQRISITEHAIVRYVERILKLDLKEIQSVILSAQVRELVSKCGGNGTFPNEHGFSVIIKDYTVVTIY